jgi:hypothetical protein
MIYYVCSFGGCGSTILSKLLKPYGQVKHIHSRKPPFQLEYVGGHIYREWFNGINVSNPEEYKVIYIYRNPVDAILSRFHNPNHLKHIQCQQVTIDKVIKEKQDLFGINEFYNNYMNGNTAYPIICVKYEELFEKQALLSEILQIGPLNFKKIENFKNVDKTILNEIYEPLINKMNKNNFIIIKKPFKPKL